MLTKCYTTKTVDSDPLTSMEDYMLKKITLTTCFTEPVDSDLLTSMGNYMLEKQCLPPGVALMT